MGTIQGQMGVEKTDKSRRDVAVQTQVLLAATTAATVGGQSVGIEERHATIPEGIPERQEHADNVLENRTAKSKAVDSSAAGSALALILAIAVMVIA